MEENNLYWLKLYNDFMDRDEIQILRAQENGDSYIVFYITLMLKSEKTGGYMRLNNNIAYDARMLAAVTRTNIDIVKAAMTALENLGMLVILEDGTIFIPEVQKLIGTSANNANAKRQQRFRDNKKLAAMAQSVTENNARVTEGVTQSVTKNNACVTEGVTQSNVELELELELELDKEREKKREKNADALPSLEEVKEYARKECSFVNPVRFFNYYQMRDWKVNGRKIKDWRAAFRLWESREDDMKVALRSPAEDTEYSYLANEYSQEELNRADDPDQILAELLGRKGPRG